MIGLGALAALISVVGLWITRKNATREVKPWQWRVALWSAPVPLIAILMGWIFTEMGRQPWIVFGLMKTADGVSPNITGLQVLISLVTFTLIYGVLAVVEFKLLRKAAITGPDDWENHTDPDAVDTNRLATVY
jgi:cytochrome d ubiquinol oxidase subunit I